MIVWKTVKDKDRFGIAIHNWNGSLSGPVDHSIRLVVGETVEFLLESSHWYYGFSRKRRNQQGIFPKSYVHVAEFAVEKAGGNYDMVVLKQPVIVQEITSVLREWGTLWKHLYITHNENFEQIQKMIYELIRYRIKILSGTLPVDEMKDMKQLVTAKIDAGNKILGLDMVVRDDHGNVLNPDTTSTIQLYQQHVMATERIHRTTKDYGTERRSTKHSAHIYSHIFFVSVRNFVCKMSDDCELLMTLYDAKENRAVTENYVVNWSKQGLTSDIDQLHNLKVLFTDLGSRDLQRDRVYLVCYVVRVGSMDNRDQTDHRRSSMLNSSKNNSSNSTISLSSATSSTGSRRGHFDGMRRPFGVAAMDVTPFLWEKMEGDEEKHHFVPFMPCEKDNLDSTLRKIINNKDQNKNDNRGQGLWVSVKLLHGDIKQVREENPHLVLGNVSLARKMGFPEVILPGDVRNDLYLTLINGEFAKGAKSTDKNVEVTVTVCNEMGEPLPGVMTLGGGARSLNEYKSVIYYHVDKPHWYEIFKVAVPIDEFKASHLKFMFKHRSSNEAKDKSEKPFAMSYVMLMQKDGTTLKDQTHDLLVYKIDQKRFLDTDLGYLSLPSHRSSDGRDLNPKPSAPGLSLSSKDSFRIATNVCSTKLTQNVDLLGLLNWANHKDTLKDSLNALMKVDGDDIVKFLQDVLDALFNILVQNDDSAVYDYMVFESLLKILSLVSDRKYQHFQPVLDLYIQESFSATLAYKKLLMVLKHHIDNTNSTASQELLLKIMKSLQYLIKFIVRSRLLFAELYDSKNEEQFNEDFQHLFWSITDMMCHTTGVTLLPQGAFLKYLPTTIDDILQVYNGKQLSILITELIEKVPQNRLAKQKIMTVNSIVLSSLFKFQDCRAVLLPMICRQVKEFLETKEEMEICAKILSDTMNLLFTLDLGASVVDIKIIMNSVLRTVIQTIVAMGTENNMVGNFVAIMISIFRQMTFLNYEEYIEQFANRTDILDFLMEILMVFEDLVTRPVFPQDWCDMVMLQNAVMLKSLREFSLTMRKHFLDCFDHQAWNNFFHCAIAFLTQPALQLETFTSTKRARIISRYKDMRREAAFEIRSMWLNLGQYKAQFVPALVGSILEMTLIPDTELRKATIPIFFDMMQCEFYSSKHIVESYGDTKRDSSHIKGKFTDFENEMIAKLDILIEGGRGDEQYTHLFNQILLELCEQHNSLRDQGKIFVVTVTRLMERLLEYRCIINDENKENRMACTVSLLDFYSEINRKEMYIRYVNKLCDLHLECDNYTEAAYTLTLHSNLLNWSDSSLPPLLKSHKYNQCQTHRELKEALYYDIMHYYDKGKMWECALSICKELVSQYEDEVYDYNQLSELLKRMAQFYDCIMKQIRPEPEYFRVAYYGRGFPPFLQNKVFVYRGKEYERLSDFRSRTLNTLPNAELMSTLSLPGDDIKECNGQYVQINNVEPVMEDRQNRFSGKPVNDQILKYHKVNNIKTFKFSRPSYQRDSGTSEQNEFATLWLERTILKTSYPLPGILRWFPVVHSETFNISPLRNAIETMEGANRSLRDLIISYKSDPMLPLNPLSLKLNGIVDAAVMGGVTNYEVAFFTDEYLEKHPEDANLVQKLKDLVASQIPLLEIGITLHKQRAPPSLIPLNNRLEQCFLQMRAHVEEKYGKKSCDVKLDRSPMVTMRGQFSGRTQNGTQDTNNRLSELSMGSSDGGRSRVSSLSRSQTNSISNKFRYPTGFNLPNMSPSLSLTRNSGSSSTKSMLNTSQSPSPTKAKREKDKLPTKRRSSRKLDREALSLQLGPQTPTTNSTTTHWYTSSTPDGEHSISMNSTINSSINSTSNSMNINVASTPQTSLTMESPKIVELTEELISKRPLRSEVEREKRLSGRPSSGQFPNQGALSVGAGGVVAGTPTRMTGQNGAESNDSSNRNSIGTTDSTTSEDDLRPPPLPLKSREVDSITSYSLSGSNVTTNVTTIVIQSGGDSGGGTPPPPPLPRSPDKTPPTPPPKPSRPSKPASMRVDVGDNHC